MSDSLFEKQTKAYTGLGITKDEAKKRAAKRLGYSSGTITQTGSGKNTKTISKTYNTQGELTNITVDNPSQTNKNTIIINKDTGKKFTQTEALAYNKAVSSRNRNADLKRNSYYYETNPSQVAPIVQGKLDTRLSMHSQKSFEQAKRDRQGADNWRKYAQTQFSLGNMKAYNKASKKAINYDLKANSKSAFSGVIGATDTIGKVGGYLLLTKPSKQFSNAKTFVSKAPAEIVWFAGKTGWNVAKYSQDKEFRTQTNKKIKNSNFMKNPDLYFSKTAGEFATYSKAFQIAGSVAKGTVARGKVLLGTSTADAGTVAKGIQFKPVMSENVNSKYLLGKQGTEVSVTHVSQGGFKVNPLTKKGQFKGFPGKAEGFRNEVQDWHTFFSSPAKATGKNQAYLGYLEGVNAGASSSSKSVSFSIFKPKNYVYVTQSKVAKLPAQLVKSKNALAINKYIGNNPGKLYVTGENIAKVSTEGQFVASSSWKYNGFSSTGTEFKVTKNLGQVIYREPYNWAKTLNLKPKSTAGKLLTNKHITLNLRRMEILPGVAAKSSSNASNIFSKSAVNNISSSSAKSINLAPSLFGASSSIVSASRSFITKSSSSSRSSFKPISSGFSSSKSSFSSSLSSVSSLKLSSKGSSSSKKSSLSSLSSISSGFSSSSGSSSSGSALTPSSSIGSSFSYKNSRPKNIKSPRLKLISTTQKKGYTPSAFAIFSGKKGKKSTTNMRLGFGIRNVI